jgi:tetratricopeptide (TPR) repeat protein
MDIMVRSRFRLMSRTWLVPLALAILFGQVNMAPAADDSLLILYNNLGVIHARNHNWDAALTYFDSALSRDRANPAVLGNIGSCHLCSGDINLALEDFGKSTAAGTGNTAVLFNWGLALYFADRQDEAMAKLQEFLTASGSNTHSDEFVAGLYSDLGLQKGDTRKLSKAEIRKLLERAETKMKSAAEKKHQKEKDSGLTQTPDSTAKVGTSGNIEPKAIPAGAKSKELDFLSEVLYWQIL